MLKIGLLKNKLALKVLLVVAAGAGLFFYAKTSSGANRDFAPADDFPRGALVYAQFRDLPALLKTWDESELKKLYLESENFRQFQNRHLALKLVSRWQEFNDALGFETSAEALSRAAETQAAVAVYDIGKMEIVFIAPVSEEKFAATMFFQNKDNFEVNELPDQTVYYSRKVEADGGRQQQKVLFANVKGRFVLATSENLLLRAAANINRTAQKDSLTDEPNFAALTERLSPRLAAVWVDQTKLNEDWYFKRYWLMRNIAELKKFRAGIFDFEMQNGKLVERREFLLTENKKFAEQKIANQEVAALQLFAPKEVPFFRLQSVAGKPEKAASLLRDTILDRSPAVKTVESRRRWNTYDTIDYSGSNSKDSVDYSYLDSRFDKFINEENELEAENKNGTQTVNQENNLRQVLEQTQISSVVTIVNPRPLNAPLFMEFQKATAFYLAAPEKLDRSALENAISLLVADKLIVSDGKANFIWDSENSAVGEWRRLNFPALNREICYTLRDNVLLISNSAEFLEAVLNNKESFAPPPDSFNELSVIRVAQKASAFDAPMKTLVNEEKKTSPGEKSVFAESDFFTGSIGSLLTAAHQAHQIEIRRNFEEKFMSEEIAIFYK